MDNWDPLSHSWCWLLKYRSQGIPVTIKTLDKVVRGHLCISSVVRGGQWALSFSTFSFCKGKGSHRILGVPLIDKCWCNWAIFIFRKNHRAIKNTVIKKILLHCLFKEKVANSIITVSQHMDILCSQTILVGSSIVKGPASECGETPPFSWAAPASPAPVSLLPGQGGTKQGQDS